MSDLGACAQQLSSADAEERRDITVQLGRMGEEAVPLLFRALGDGDWRVRKTAVEALVSLGSDAVIDGLIRTLNTGDNAGARNSAIEALVAIGGRSVDALLGIIETPDPDVRKFVVDILGDMKDPRAAPALLARIEDADENVQVASAEALGKLRDRRAVEPLVACLRRTDRGWLDYAAAEALGEIGDERALAPLLAALDRSSLREPVLEALGKIGNASALGPLLASLADPLRIVREVVVVAIVAIYRKSPPLAQRKLVATVRAAVTDGTAGLLEDILSTGTGDLQKAAMTLIGWTGRDQSIRKMLSIISESELAEHAVKALRYLDRTGAVFLIEYLTNENALVRGVAAQVLGAVGVREAEDALICLLADENGHVRSSAAEALSALRSSKAARPLLELLSDEYQSVQESAIFALAAIGDESLIEGLMQDFATHDTFLRRNIARLFGKLSNERAAEALAFALKDEEPSVRKAVVEALAPASDDAALRPLLLAVTDDDPEVRMLAAEALGGRMAPDALEALILLLEDTDLWVRAAAARGLGKTGGDAALKALFAHLATATDVFQLAIIEVLGSVAYPAAGDQLQRLADHPDQEVRKTVLGALAGYAGESSERTVIGRLSDPHWSVRKAAVEALGRKRTPAIDSLLMRAAEADPDNTVRHAAREALGR